MSSGVKSLIVNALERALSSDVNRLQAFSGAQLCEVFRGLIDTGMGTDDLDAGALVQPHSSAGTPSAGEVVTGFLLLPTNGSTACALGTGANGPNILFLYDPDTIPNPDDSQYKLVNDPGTNNLTLTGNSSGSTRIDVVECARVQPDNVVETDNRDVYNTITGTFGAATVNKVQLAQLQYRIRLGTAGSGLPAAQQGWLPLYITSVPTGTTTWDTVTIWDVRPLLNDRRYGVSATTHNPEVLKTNFLSNNPGTGATGLQLTGSIEATYNGRRLGGVLQRGTPGTDFGYVDIGPLTKDNWDPNATFSTGSLVYVYLLLPSATYPRWARFTDAASGPRQPRSPRGMFVVTSVAPLATGSPSAGIGLPTSTGLGGTTTAAVCVACTVASASTKFWPWGTDGKLTQYFGTNQALPTITNFPSPAITHTFENDTFTLVAGTHYPACARKILLSYSTEITTTANLDVDHVMRVYWPSDATNVFLAEYLPEQITDASGNAVLTFVRWIPVPSNASQFQVNHFWDAGSTGVGSTANVIGWEFGP